MSKWVKYGRLMFRGKKLRFVEWTYQSPTLELDWFYNLVIIPQFTLKSSLWKLLDNLFEKIFGLFLHQTSSGICLQLVIFRKKSYDFIHCKTMFVVRLLLILIYFWSIRFLDLLCCKHINQVVLYRPFLWFVGVWCLVFVNSAHKHMD